VPILRITLLLIVSFSANAVFADPVAEVRAAQAVRIEATINADVEALDKCYADDLVYAHSSGNVDDRGSLLANIGSGKVDYQKLDIVEQGIRIFGDVAIITGSADFYVVANDVVNEMTLRFTSVYVRKNDRWQFASWHSSRVASDG
jgi:ketosteroid isomerase-like protein